MARTLALPKGSIVAMDRGYFDYDLFGGVYCVSHLKSNLPLQGSPAAACTPRETSSAADEEIQLTGDRARKHCPYTLRRVVVWDEENRHELALVTNQMELAADAIGAI